MPVAHETKPREISTDSRLTPKSNCVEALAFTFPRTRVGLIFEQTAAFVQLFAQSTILSRLK
jgi:hypothetical protein